MNGDALSRINETLSPYVVTINERLSHICRTCIFFNQTTYAHFAMWMHDHADKHLYCGYHSKL